MSVRHVLDHLRLVSGLAAERSRLVVHLVDRIVLLKPFGVLQRPALHQFVVSEATARP